MSVADEKLRIILSKCQALRLGQTKVSVIDSGSDQSEDDDVIDAEIRQAFVEKAGPQVDVVACGSTLQE